MITFTKMKCTVLVTEKTKEGYLEEGIRLYLKRLQHYTVIEWKTKPGNKKKTHEAHLLKTEKDWFLAQMETSDYVVALDDRGLELNSLELAHWIEQKNQCGKKRWLILIGSAYGFDPEVLRRCDARISLSKLTFTHQMVRLIFLEQWYRAHTILKGESYHHA